MNPRTFYDCVKVLRYYQKDYFKTRSRESLNEAKKYEKIIDDEISRVDKIYNSKKE